MTENDMTIFVRPIVDDVPHEKHISILDWLLLEKVVD